MREHCQLNEHSIRIFLKESDLVCTQLLIGVGNEFRPLQEGGNDVDSSLFSSCATFARL